MKYLLFVLISFFSLKGFAQVVNIPDANFKEFLLEYSDPVIDVNADGEIEETEAQAITNLSLVDYDFYNITDLTGIKSFINLDSLWTGSLNQISNIDFSGMPALRIVYLDGFRFKSLDFSNCPNLKVLDIENHVETSGADSISYLNLTGDHRLKILSCSPLNVADFDLRPCDSLNEFYMSWGDIHGMLNVSGHTQLLKISMGGHVGAINAVGSLSLNTILGGGYEGVLDVDDLFVNGCTNLAGINIHYNGASLDLSSCTGLTSFSINSPNLRYLNIKNGRQQNVTAYIFENPNPAPLYVCTDDIETNAVTNQLMQDNGSNAPITVNSFCSPTPGGTFNTITGQLRVDVNSNGCDNGDEQIANVPVSVFNGDYSVVRYTNTSGRYSHYDFAGNYTVAPYFPYPYFTLSPAAANIVFDTANNLTDTLNFCITPNGIHNQLEVLLVPEGGARPGFTSHYQLLYRNRGTTTLSGNVQLNFDYTKVNYISSSVIPGSQSQGTLNWSYNNLLPLESRYIDVNFSVLAPPVNNLGDTLIYLAAVTPLAADETPGDNSFVLPQGLTNSFDPNEKRCLEGDKLDITQIGGKLHYVIHFQNMGTDTAFNVVITDTLTSNVDWETFDLLASSHVCDVKRINNQLEFYFRNIRLPYQAINDEGSNGFVTFEVRSKNSLAVGDSINNKAYIYFDFNPAVITNIASTVIVPTSPLAVKLEYFSVSKKDETNILTWKATSTDGSTNFGIERSADGIHFSNLGTITATTERCQLPFNYTDEKPLTGKNYYRLKITDADGHSFYSKILEIGNNKSGVEVTAVTSDGNNTILYLNALNEQTVQLKIIATDGRIVYAQSKTVAAGNNAINLQLRNLTKGAYSLVVYTNEGEIITKRFIK